MTAAETLVAFFQRMNAWESESATRERRCDEGEMSYDDSSAQGEEAYLQIYREFVAADHVPLRSFQFSEPPDYDPARESVVTNRQLAPDSVEIGTEIVEGIPHSHIYRLILRDGRWWLTGKWFIGGRGDRIPATL